MGLKSHATQFTLHLEVEVVGKAMRCDIFDHEITSLPSCADSQILASKELLPFVLLGLPVYKGPECEA